MLTRFFGFFFECPLRPPINLATSVVVIHIRILSIRTRHAVIVRAAGMAQHTR